MHGVVMVARTKNQTVGLEVKEANVQTRFGLDSIYRGLERAIPRQRIVVPINHNGCVRLDDRLHASGMLGIGSDSYKTLPRETSRCRMGAGKMKDGVRNIQHFEDSGWRNARLRHSRSVGNDRDNLHERSRNGIQRWWSRHFLGGQKVEDGKMLCRQHTIHAVEAQRPLAIEEVRDVGVAESCGASQTGTGKKAASHASQDFKAEVFM